MTDSKKVTALIVKLIRETKEGNIVWRTSNTLVQFNGGSELLYKVYVANYKSRFFRIYKYRDRHYTDIDTYGWTERTQLDITDAKSNPEWSFPEEQAVRDLYDTVRFQVAGVSQLLNDILDDDDLVESNDFRL